MKQPKCPKVLETCTFNDLFAVDPFPFLKSYFFSRRKGEKLFFMLCATLSCLCPKFNLLQRFLIQFSEKFTYKFLLAFCNMIIITQLAVWIFRFSANKGIKTFRTICQVQISSGLFFVFFVFLKNGEYIWCIELKKKCYCHILWGI